MSENEIPKQYDPAAAQEKWAKFWDENHFFRPQTANRKCPQNSAGSRLPSAFCVVIPPPNVTGALHMGHALNNTLQDIIVRMKRMQGFDTLWIPGVDHAGIATQAVVERKLFEEEKLTRHDIGREALVQRIWNWKEKYQQRIIDQLKGMGCSCDWSRIRFTLDDVCAKAVRHFFFKLFEQKLIYRGKRLVNWDTHLQTAVSDDEVFHETVAGNFWYIKYEVCRRQTADGSEQTIDNFDKETADVGLSRPQSVAESSGLDGRSLPLGQKITEGRNVCAVQPDAEGSGVNSVQHSGGTGQELQQGICQLSAHCTRVEVGTGNSTPDKCQSEVSDRNGYSNSNAIKQRSRQYAVGSDNTADTIDGGQQTEEKSAAVCCLPSAVIIATTRPETLLGDTAVAVHPDPETALRKATDDLKKRLAAAPEKEKNALQTELESVEKRFTDGTLDRLKKLAEMAKNGVMLKLPLTNREIPLIADVWAKPEKGTGCVKITPAHDPNDYEVGKRNHLPMVNILNKDGTLNENAGQYAGLTMKKAREKVVADLETAGLLLKTEEREIELAHSDRSKTPIEPFLNDQWFVKMESLAQAAIDSVETAELSSESGQPSAVSHLIRIIPHRYTKSYLDWLSEKRDWPIGRQLWWGHRIPIWHCEGADEAELQKAFAGRKDISWQRDEEGNGWRICSQTEDLKADAVPGYQLIQEEDVLDTWFSSALWPLSTLKYFEDDKSDYERYYPTGVLITNRDILTLWVARMVLAGQFNTGTKPFSEVYIHPKILDKYGEGMSKSKGNGVDPLSVINKFGADALRFALAYLTTENQDIRLTLDFECPHCGTAVEQTKKNRILPRVQCPKCKQDFRTQWAEKPEDKALPEGVMVGERFEAARNFCNKLWNAARFVLMSLSDESSKQNKDTDNPVLFLNFSEYSPLEDKWILSRLHTVIRNVTDNLEHYHYAEAMRTLYDFAWDEFCSFYVEMVKSRLNDDFEREKAQSMLCCVLRSLIKLLHPVIPFVTEEIYQRLTEAAGWFELTDAERECMASKTDKPESLSVAAFPVANEEFIKPEIEKQFAVFQELLRAVRDVRASRNIPPKTEISFSVKCDAATSKLLEPMKPYFASMARAKMQDSGGKGLTATVPLAGMDLIVDLSDLIDVPAEMAKLEKELAKLDGFIKSKEAKLSSDFVQKAPPNVVDNERKGLADLQTQRQSAAEALAKLKAAV